MLGVAITEMSHIASFVAPDWVSCAESLSAASIASYAMVETEHERRTELGEGVEEGAAEGLLVREAEVIDKIRHDRLFSFSEDKQGPRHKGGGIVYASTGGPIAIN